MTLLQKPTLRGWLFFVLYFTQFLGFNHGKSYPTVKTVGYVGGDLLCVQNTNDGNPYPMVSTMGYLKETTFYERRPQTMEIHSLGFNHGKSYPTVKTVGYVGGDLLCVQNTNDGNP